MDKSDILEQENPEILEKIQKYQKKIKNCEKLGALKFQKVVFKVEDIKFKVLKNVCPSFMKYYEKYCDYHREKKLKKLHSDTTKKEIIDFYREQKFQMRKEFHREQNRNYHINENNPTDFLRYLEWNKEIHKTGLKKDLIVIPALVVAIGCGIAGAIPLLGLEVASLFINFECVNIQNYNIYRFKQKEEKIKKLEKLQEQRKVSKYSLGAPVIVETLNKTKEIPSMEEIIGNITNKEQLIQLRKQIQETKVSALNALNKERRGK